MKKMFTALCLLCSLNAISQTTYFVNDNAFGANNGRSWRDAFTKLQDALAAAVNGDKIWVAAGTYYPDERQGLTFTKENFCTSIDIGAFEFQNQAEVVSSFTLINAQT